MQLTMPDTTVMPDSRKTASESPQIFGWARRGSNANWTRRMPVARSFCTRSSGLAGCSDQLQTARRSRMEGSFIGAQKYADGLPGGKDYAVAVTRLVIRTLVKKFLRELYRPFPPVKKLKYVAFISFL